MSAGSRFSRFTFSLKLTSRADDVCALAPCFGRSRIPREIATSRRVAISLREAGFTHTSDIDKDTSNYFCDRTDYFF